MPEPRARQLLPFQAAMLLAARPPAIVKSPPAYSVLPLTASAYTGPSTPEPRACQLLPSQVATWLAATPPAVVKLPPAYSVLPLTASASTSPSMPEPRRAPTAAVPGRDVVGGRPPGAS